MYTVAAYERKLRNKRRRWQRLRQWWWWRLKTMSFTSNSPHIWTVALQRDQLQSTEDQHRSGGPFDECAEKMLVRSRTRYWKDIYATRHVAECLKLSYGTTVLQSWLHLISSCPYTKKKSPAFVLWGRRSRHYGHKRVGWRARWNFLLWRRNIIAANMRKTCWPPMELCLKIIKQYRRDLISIHY